MNDKASLSSFLNGTFDELRANSTIALIYLAIMVPTGALAGFFSPGNTNEFFNFGLMIDEALLAQGAFAVISVLGAFVVGLIAYYWLIAAMVFQTTSPGFERIMPFLGIAVLSWVGIGFGMVLFLIPGIYLAVRWVAVLPLVISRQDKAMDSFGDSNQLTQGFGWPILGTGLILFVAMIVLAAITGGIGVVLSGLGSFSVAISNSLLESISSLVFAGFTVTVYRQLGNNQEELAEVFG